MPIASSHRYAYSRAARGTRLPADNARVIRPTFVRKDLPWQNLSSSRLTTIPVC